METLKFSLTGKEMCELTNLESRSIDGGTWLITPPFVAISAFAGAAMCIFEFGKATGNFVYQVIH